MSEIQPTRVFTTYRIRIIRTLFMHAYALANLARVLAFIGRPSMIMITPEQFSHSLLIRNGPRPDFGHFCCTTGLIPGWSRSFFRRPRKKVNREDHGLSDMEVYHHCKSLKFMPDYWHQISSRRSAFGICTIARVDDCVLACASFALADDYSVSS